MNILFVAAEASPLAKVGGLADVAGALPRELRSLGHDARLVIPSYPMIESNPKYQLDTVVERFGVPVGDGSAEAYAKQTEVGGVPVYLVGSGDYFQEATQSSKVYVPGSEPYIFFARAVMELLKTLGPDWKPDVIHCNDWHTGLIPVYLRTLYADDPAYAGMSTVFTIHNLAYQGEFDESVLDVAGLPRSLYTMDQLECYGKANLMKGGIVFSDLVNTVSKKYADEIQTEEFGCRLDGLLRYVSSQGRLRGILNGLDYSEFNSETDRRISHNYSAGDAEGKWVNKADLQKQVGLPEKENVPLFGLVSRLVDQKGLDLIKAAMPKFMEMDVQFVLLGTGEPAYEAYFKEVEAEHPDKMSAQIGFDVVLAQKIYAGCDVFLMPSRFEPCGLGQMISLRYGTIPLVRATGGLADTIDEFDPSNMSGNGFVFSEYTEDAFFDAVKRSVSTYQSPEKWRGLISNAMACDFSCGSSANEYLTYYNSAVELGRKRAAA